MTRFISPGLCAQHFFGLLLLPLLALSSACCVHAAIHSGALPLTASTSATVPHVTLIWSYPTDYTDFSSCQLWRRGKGSDTWSGPVSITPGFTSWADNDAQPGVAYEYALRFTPASFAASPTVNGGIVAGRHIPLVERRGNVLLYVDETQAGPLAPELSRLARDMIADGWTVYRHDGPREVYPASSTNPAHYAGRLAERVAMRATIKSYYDLAPDEDWALLIIGRAPIAYSGNQSPDGHGDHRGAWPTDTYYADMNGTWTDSSVNITTAASTRNHNIPGDGKFDQTAHPAPLVFQVGRVDLSLMDNVPPGFDETELLRQYLNRDHYFRRGLAPYDNIARRGLIHNGFTGSLNLSASAWCYLTAFFGSGAGKVDDGIGWFSTLNKTSLLFGYMEGYGYYTGAGAVQAFGDYASTVNYSNTDARAVFNVGYGSYFGDWDWPSNVLRAPLAGTPGSLGLSSYWGYRGLFFHMGLGDTLGYGIRVTQNYNAASHGAWSGGGRSVTCNLMGDPTLRLHTVPPPIAGTARSTPGGVLLEWQPTPDGAVAGYHVYRAPTPAGPFTRLTGVAATGSVPLGAPLSESTFAWLDAGAVSGNTYTWLVKAVKVETTGSGTYVNQSLGEAVTFTHAADGAAPPAAPSLLTVSATGTTTRALDWLDNADNEPGFTIQRHNLVTGEWLTIGSTSANAHAFTDTAAPAGVLSHYRVRAQNAHGASAWSDAAADYTRPGSAIPPAHIAVDRAAGPALVPVQRLYGGSGAVALPWQTATVSGSFAAVPGVDYVAGTGAVSWTHGDAAPATLMVPLPAASASRLSRFFRINHSAPTNGLTLGTVASTWVQVYDSAALDLCGWQTAFIGSPPSPWPGFAEYDAGTFGLSTRSGKTGDGLTVDSCRLVYLPVTGDARLTVRLTGVEWGMSGNARAGILIRASLATNAIMRTAYVHQTGIAQGARTSAGGKLQATTTSGVSAPRWLRLQRTGSVVSLWHSADGVSWTALGSPATLSLPGSAYIGMFLDSYTPEEGRPSYARFDNVTLEAALTTPEAFTARSGPSVGVISLGWNVVPGATSYEIQRSTSPDSGFAGLATIAAPADSWSDANLPAGTVFYYRIRAVAGSSQSAWAPVDTALPWLPAGIEGWRYLNFGSGQPETITGDFADPDGDGLPNLIEYATGSPPLDAANGGVPGIGATDFAGAPAILSSAGHDYFTLAFARDPSARGVRLTLEAAEDLNDAWEAINPLLPANQISVENDTPLPGLQRIVARDTRPVSEFSRRFLRLRATRFDISGDVYTGFEPGAGYLSCQSIIGLDDPGIPGAAVWTAFNTASATPVVASATNPLVGGQSLRFEKTETDAASGVVLNLSDAGVDFTASSPLLFRFSLAISSYSAGTGSQLQVYLGDAGSLGSTRKYWAVMFFNNGAFSLYRADAAGTGFLAINLGTYITYSNLGDYITFELAFDPVAKTYTRIKVIGKKKTEDFTATLAGVPLPWRPASAGDPGSFFQLILGTDDQVVADLDEISLSHEEAAVPGEPLATWATVPGGLLKVDLPGGTPAAPSTTRFALPLTGDPENAGAREGFITSLSGTNLTLTGAGWTPGQLAASPHAMRLADGARAGLTLTVVANITDTLTVAAPDDLGTLGVAVGDRFRVIPVDMLGTLFPPGVLIGGPGPQSADIVFLGRASQSGYYFNSTLSRWVSATGPTIDRGGVAIPPDASISIARTGPAISLLFTGRAPPEPFVVAVPGGGSLHTHTGFPVDTTLGGLALQTRVPGWVSAASAGQADQVLLPAPSGWTAYYHNGMNWRLATGPAISRDTTVIGCTTPLLLLRHDSQPGIVELRLPVPYSLE